MPGIGFYLAGVTCSAMFLRKSILIMSHHCSNCSHDSHIYIIVPNIRRPWNYQRAFRKGWPRRWEAGEAARVTGFVGAWRRKGWGKTSSQSSASPRRGERPDLLSLVISNRTWGTGMKLHQGKFWPKPDQEKALHWEVGQSQEKGSLTNGHETKFQEAAGWCKYLLIRIILWK